MLPERPNKTVIQAIGPASAPLRRAAAFRQDESGGLVIFSVFLLIGILLVGGLSIDLMRTETKRAKLQGTADRAVLAAASATQEREPADVVRDYFNAAGLGEELDTVDVTGVLTAREVTASAGAPVSASFLRLVGIESFSADAIASASEKITAVEVSMVLDISGSMSGSKLDRLQDAGVEFVEAVFGSVPTSESMINIVPYNAQVNAGPDLLRQFNITSGAQDYSHCVEFYDEDFQSVALSTTAELGQAGHFDPFSGYGSNGDADTFVCNPEAYAEILPYSNDPNALIAKINSLQAGGNTSIDLGMKWGASLLDDSAQPILAGLVDDGVVSAEFDGRPHSVEEYPGIKVVVLMTDGQNTTEHRLRDEFKSGDSDVWRDPDTGRLSIKETVPYSDYEDYCEEYLDDGSGGGSEGYWEWRRYYGWVWVPGSSGMCDDYEAVEAYYAPHNDTWYDEPYGGSNAARLTYPELWNEVSVRHHAYMRYLATGDADDYYAWDNEPYTAVGSGTKNSRLMDICQATKDEGIVVYTIAVEAPSSSNDLLRQCATSPSHHFDVDRFDIGYAFGAIITSINYLRLTQ